MRHFRNSLFFLLGLFLGGFAVVAFASDTNINATPVTKPGVQCTGKAIVFGSFATGTLGCQALGFWGFSSGSCVSNPNTPPQTVCTNFVNGNFGTYECPTGQNWTLNGTLCTRPACIDPETRQSDGTCSSPKCASAANEKLGSGRYEIPNPQPPGVTWCVNNCEAYPAGSTNKVGNIMYTEMFVNGPGGDGSTCKGSSVAPNNIPNPTVKSEAPCAHGDGSITVDGKVKCVASTTPGATVPPIVNKSTKTDTKSDGSKIITETTNTCTGDGACTSTSTITITNNTAGQPGLAGAPGVSTSVSDKPSTEQSEFCAKNPNLQFCKGGMNEEATQKKVLEEIKKLTSPDATDDSSLKSATHSADSQKALEDEDKKFKDAGEGTFDPISAKKGVWASAMDSGWFSPIPSTNCTPFEATIAGRVFRMDHCPTAQKISEIGGYAMWFMLVVGVFVMLTGGNREGVA